MRIKNKTTLTSHGNIKGRKIVTELLDAGLDSIDPYYRVKKLIKVENGKIILDTKAKALEQLEELHKQIDLLNYKENFYKNLIKNNLKDAWNPMNSMQSKDVAV